MRTIGVVTVARSDYGIYRPLLRAIEADPDLELRLFVSGMHLSAEFGSTVEDILTDGYIIEDQVEMLLSSDSPQGVAKSMGLGMIGFAQTYARNAPDLLMTLGDRFEMLAAVTAALPFNLPIAHLHGGEITEGAFDDAARHAITKMSHLHFVSTKPYGRRIIQMGEEPWRVTVSGAPALDNLNDLPLLGKRELEQRVGMKLDSPPLLVTYHPVTRENGQTADQIGELLCALKTVDLPVIFTYPNADPSGRIVIQAIDRFVRERESAQAVKSLGTQAYFSLMHYAAAMVGNSSSGIIEAASFELPVVNIGSRQRGRVHGGNVIHVENDRMSIVRGVANVTSPHFRASLAGIQNPYGDGHATPRIVEVLRTVVLDRALVAKPFYDLPAKGLEISGSTPARN